MTLGQEIHLAGNWAIIHFTENNGMAFGMQFAGDYGKLFLSLFRIAAVILLTWYIYHLSRKKEKFWLIFSFSLILAGAIGNIIDSAFYGMLFSESTYFNIARLFPAEGGYSNFLHGRVVDMLYFPILEGTYPHWVPFWGGDQLLFFRPVFNVADSSITTGVITLILFQRNFFQGKHAEPNLNENPAISTDTFENIEPGSTVEEESSRIQQD